MPFDPRSAAARLARAKASGGLAPKGLVKQMTPGAVFLVRDEAVDMPTAGARRLHDFRHVLIVSATALNRATRPNTLMVVPCSASHTTADYYDVAVPRGEGGFDPSKTIVAVTSLVGPVLKSDLEKHLGDVTDDTLQAIHARICTNMGVLIPRVLDTSPLDEPSVSGVHGPAPVADENSVATADKRDG